MIFPASPFLLYLKRFQLKCLCQVQLGHYPAEIKPSNQMQLTKKEEEKKSCPNTFYKASSKTAAVQIHRPCFPNVTVAGVTFPKRISFWGWCFSVGIVSSFRTYISLDRFSKELSTSLFRRQHNTPAPPDSLSFQMCYTSTSSAYIQSSKAHSSMFSDLWLQVKIIPLRRSHNGDVYDVLFAYRKARSWR